jgi:hypothetical protein
LRLAKCNIGWWQSARVKWRESSEVDENTQVGRDEAKKTHSNSDSGSLSLITSSSKASPICAGVFLATFSAMVARAFSRRESRYSCDISSSSSSSELPATGSDSDSDSEDEEREDVEEPEDVEDLEENPKDSARSSVSAGCNLPFPFCDTESAIAY